MERIDSLQNNRIKKWVLLQKKKGRDESGLFLVEGQHLIEEALRAGVVETIITDRDPIFDFEPTIMVTEAIMHKLTQTPSGTHWIAVCHKPEMTIEKQDRILMLDGIQDPGNFGTLIRTAISFNFDVVYCSGACCDLYNDKVIRSTQGALFGIPIIRCDLEEEVARLQADGITVVATTLEQAVPMQSLISRDRMAFILGNEGQGVTPSLQRMADERVRIEMNGFESLNVAVAGGILMYQYRGKI